LRGALILI